MQQNPTTCSTTSTCTTTTTTITSTTCTTCTTYTTTTCRLQGARPPGDLAGLLGESVGEEGEVVGPWGDLFVQFLRHRDQVTLRNILAILHSFKLHEDSPPRLPIPLLSPRPHPFPSQGSRKYGTLGTTFPDK